VCNRIEQLASGGGEAVAVGDPEEGGLQIRAVGVPQATARCSSPKRQLR